MSVFDDVPEGFPLNVSLASRPVEFQLSADGTEKSATVILALLWGLGMPAVLLFLAQPFAPWTGDPNWTMRALALAALLAFLVFGIGYWLGPAVLSATRQVSVQISDQQIDVEVRNLLGRRRWSKPIAEYDGVAIEHWGTRGFGDNKIPVAAVVLKHREEPYSVPLMIDGALKVKESGAKRKADQLGLSMIPGKFDGSTSSAYPPGTIVVNRYQAFKVRVLYGAFASIGLATFAWMVSAAWTGGNAGLIVPALLGLLVAVGMHIFARCYVTAMRGTGSHVEIETPALMSSTQLIPREDIRAVEYREGRSESHTRHAVHAPWVKVRVSGYFLPFVVDMQSDFVDEGQLIALIRRPA